MKSRRWKKDDPLFRGDEEPSPRAPSPASKTTIVEHIMYFGGRGRETPYCSTTESEEVAEYFAGAEGAVWATTAARAGGAGAKHISRSDLLTLLKGFGKGKAKWHDAFEVANARNYVEQWNEHLLDWSEVAPQAIEQAVVEAFVKGRP